MGKFVGLIGSISGKVGNVVFSKGANGTIGRSYQPQVANPKTLGQSTQRAKMNLVGRVSKITPAELLIGLGSSKVERRGWFNRHLLNVATVETSGNVMTAQIAPENVIFAEGDLTLHATVSTPVTVQSGAIELSLTLGDQELAEKYGERIIAAIVDPSDKAGYSRIYYEDIALDDIQPQQVIIRTGAPIEDGSQVNVYRIPFLLTEEGASYRTQTLANNGTDIIAKVLFSSSMVKQWGSSVLNSSTVFTQA